MVNSERETVTQLPDVLAITGASGGLGSVLLAHLQKDPGIDVVGLDICSKGESPILQADLARYESAWVEALAGVKSIVHLAGTGSPFCDWQTAMLANVDTTLNVLRAAVDRGIRQVVVVSSLWVMEGYRDVDVAITPQMAPGPVNAHGASKLAAERLARNFADVFGLSVICLRIGWVAEITHGNLHALAEADNWARQRFLHLGDFLQAMDKAITIEEPGFHVVNLVSPLKGSRWDIKDTQRLLDYVPSTVEVPTSGV
jgi:nucleoside-diphosphate-sugar epimerase